MPITTDQTERLKACSRSLPFVTSHLPGVGGEIKAAPEHFQVEEILPYAPCGEGEHVFVTLRREGWNTADVAAALADHFGLKSVDVGWGGRKDKRAVTTQTFSLHLPVAVTDAQVETSLARLPFDVLGVRRHRNKLKTGHVAGNRFRILLTRAAPGASEAAESVADAVRRHGIPNFYGEQRFGRDMANINRAVHFVERRRPARGKKDAFVVSVLQSALFNLWLTERIGRGQYETILPGDVAQKTDTGGMFVVDDIDDAETRFSGGQIVYTGPMFGPKMMPATDQAALYETRILSDAGMVMDDFKRLRAPGSRRRAVLKIDDLVIEPETDGLRFSFVLPKGAYATMVMREFMRPAGKSL